MEEENTFSGSPENTDSGSPTPISGGVSGGGTVQMEAAMIEGSAIFGGGSGGILMGKKKRGRPRKYDADGNLNPAYAAAAAKKVAQAVSPPPPPPGFTLTMAADYGVKRGRGRATGSGNWQQLAPLGELLDYTAGDDFTPYVIRVQTGEDVAAKIHSFPQKAPRGICVLSANGPISNATIRQPGSSGGLLTYEGRFEILSLSGSYTVSEAGGVTSRTGGLSITLAGPDGQVVGGSVAGWLTAASPIQVVVGSFVPHGYKAPKRKNHRESPNEAAIPAIPETVTAANPTSQQVMPMMMTSQSHSEAEHIIGSGHNLNAVSSHNTHEWNNGSQPSSDHRIYPDINISVPGV